MKVSEARAHAEELQAEGNRLLRIAGALNAAADRNRLNEVDHDPNVSEVNLGDVARGLDDAARARLQAAIEAKKAEAATTAG